MNSGALGLPSTYRTSPPRSLAMVQVTFGRDNIATQGAYGGEIFNGYNPNGFTANDNFLGGFTFRVQVPSGADIHARMGLRGDGRFGIGGGSYSTWRWYVDMSNGNMVAAGDVTANSDSRLKEDITPIQNALQVLKHIDGVSFTWKDMPFNAGKAGNRSYGFIAQQVEAVLPEAVHRNTESPGDGGDPFRTIAHDKILAVAVAAINKLAAEVENLKSQVASLSAGRL